MKRFICLALVFLLILSTAFSRGLTSVLFAEENSPAQNNVYSSQGYAFPENMRATNITIGYDFFKDLDQSAEVTQNEISQIMSDIESFGFNSIIINTSYNGIVYYEIDKKIYKNGSPLDMLIEASRSHNLFVYITFNIEDAIKSQNIVKLDEKLDYLSLCAHKLTSKYRIDGIILDGYYASKESSSYENYKEYGSGIGLDNWLRDNCEYVFRLLSDAVHSTSSSVAVGIAAANAWMNERNNPLGSDTKDDFEALADGYSDTKSYIEKGYADFVVVTCYGGLKSVELNFVSIVSWWDKLATAADIPMFISHANERISDSDSSWDAGQIIKQLEECQKYKSYRGSIFRSYELLKKNVGESTQALKKYFDGLIDTDSLYTELSMVLPKKLNYTTYEPTEKFQGTYDSNFDVYFNGKKIELNEAGNFYFEEDLEVGMNTFTFKNKAKSVVYKIMRKVKVLQSVEPEEGVELRVEGTTRINVTVIAYSGSKITATLNGEKITLTEDTMLPDDFDANTNYARFTGYFTAPEGIVGEEQDLGIISIDGNYKDICYESMNGSRVIVNAISPTAERAQLIVIKNDNTLTYDYYTTNSIPIPTSPRLPAGTMDIVVNEVTYNVTSEGVNQTIKYYLTESGLRIKASDCSVIDGFTIINNTASVMNSYVDGIDTVININLNHQIPFTISYSPLKFSSSGGDSYIVNNYEPDYVLVTFDYVSDYFGIPQFQQNSLFTDADWQRVTVDGKDKVQLRLRLRKSGVFSGYSSSYDGNGNLTLRFSGYRSNIYGAVIVVDPGHGYDGSPTDVDPGAVGHVVEQKINLGIAQKLVEKLKAAGAVVYMIPTNTTQVNVYDRSEYARRYDPDMFISIHCNSVLRGEGVRGVEAYYFTPFSQPLAAYVSKNMASYYENYVYNDGKNRNRGAKYNYFAVTLEQEFPSILVESGFVTDSKEAMALNDPDVQNGLADAIVESVIQFFARN